ncbi:hybrid sensor histidine kinase/response regulator [Spirosoma fluviale]|uniref:histidine kinase n=1 Tax=Spirosoma fluviale TaxID=1597977 RepID=A0A286FAQ2_9BACT|nr:ATP-binding protein [Spirosoma fluviale]SOD79924.1 PAS domain S-box-containing protein [Spirosoma fluviale]
MKRTVQETRQQAVQQRLILEAAKDYAIYTTDLEHRITSWNAGAEAMLGYTEAEILGQLADVLYVAGDRQRGIPQSEAQKALSEGRAENERWHSRRDGSQFYGSGVLTPLLGEAGQVIGLVKIMRDLTAQKRTEVAMSTSERRLRLAIEATELATWDWNLLTDEVHWNEQHFRLFGMESRPNTVGPDDFLSHVHPDDQDRLIQLLREAITKRSVYDTEFCAVLEDGSQRWMSGYGRVTEEVNDQPVRMNGVMFDISQRRRAEESLRQLEKRNSFLLQLSDALRPLADPISIQETVTQTTRNFFGADRCYYSLVEEGNAIIKREASRPNIPSVVGVYPLNQFPFFQALVDVGHPFVVDSVHSTTLIDAELIRQCIHLQVISFIAVPVIKNNKPVGILFMSQCEPRHWSELEVKLAQETAERTWSAVERANANEALSQTARRKDEFIAMLGHELRNPLAVLTNTLFYLQITEGQDESLSYPAGISRMSRQVQHLSRMVDDLLDVSRIRQGKIKLQRQRIDLTQVVAQTIEAVRPLFKEQNRSVAVYLPSEPLFVNGDATRLAQVLMNLLVNGAKYTNEGGHVWVSLTQEPDHVLLQVEDDGMGIPADELRAIFDVFVQGNTSLDRPHGGLGLGLAVVKQLVESHQGRIEALSAGPGQGSQFIVWLPQLTATPFVLPPETNKNKTTMNYGRVLLVDDNKELTELTTKIMQTLGYEVHACFSGQEGIEAAETWQPDVMLLDIGLPHLDGYAVCAYIRQQPWGQSLPIIALTGYGQEADKQRSWSAGFDAHLLKPIDYTALPGLISQTIAAKK